MYKNLGTSKTAPNSESNQLFPPDPWPEGSGVQTRALTQMVALFFILVCKVTYVQQEAALLPTNSMHTRIRPSSRHFHGGADSD